MEEEATKSTSAHLDLKPGILGTQANVARCDQVKACHRGQQDVVK